MCRDGTPVVVARPSVHSFMLALCSFVHVGILQSRSPHAVLSAIMRKDLRRERSWCGVRGDGGAGTCQLHADLKCVQANRLARIRATAS